MEEHDKIEIRSEEIQEILGTPPRWMIRWGTTVAFLTFCFLLFVSYFIRYPDTIEAPLTITTENPLIDIYAPVNAPLKTLYITNNQSVEKDQLLIIMSNPAEYEDILNLEDQLRNELGVVDKNTVLSFSPIRDFQLGELQSYYTDFISNYESFVFGATSNFERQNINRLQQQINSYKKAIEADKAKKPQLQIEYDVAKDALENVKKRYGSNPELITELSAASTNEARLKTELKTLETTISAKNVEISNLRKQIQDIQSQTGTNNSSLLVTLSGNVTQLLSQIENWKNKYVLKAPIDGQVVFSTDLNENQLIQKDAKILSIIPPGEEDFFGRVELPFKGSGKVDTGQIVNIKFDNFPYEEYGVIRGKVRSKAVLPQGDFYNIEVSLNKELITSHGKTLPISQEMSGTAEIVTKDKRFIERMFESVNSFFEDH